MLSSEATTNTVDIKDPTGCLRHRLYESRIADVSTINVGCIQDTSPCPQHSIKESKIPKVAQVVTSISTTNMGHSEDRSVYSHVLQELGTVKVVEGRDSVLTAEMGHSEDSSTSPRHEKRQSRMTQVTSSALKANETRSEAHTPRAQRIVRECTTAKLTRAVCVPLTAFSWSKEPVVCTRHVARGSKTVGGLLAGTTPSKDHSIPPQHILSQSRRRKVGSIPVANKPLVESTAIAHFRSVKRPLSPSFLAVTLLLYRVCGALAGRIVVDPHVTAVWGKNVTLKCIFEFIEVNENITQITWEKVLGKNPRTVAVHNPDYGISIHEGYQGRVAFKNHSRHDATIVINNVGFSDAGQYVCKAATFPRGNAQSTTTVTVIVEPTVSLTKGPHPLIDEGNLTVAAICTAANGKPPAGVHWEGGLGETEVNMSPALNDTVTVISYYKLIPTRFAQGRTITCVVNHPALENEVRYPYILDIQYAPEVTVTGHEGNWFVGNANLKLRCNAEANPPPSEYSWSRLDGQWPEGLLPKNNTLLFNSFLTHNHSGVYVCTVTNALGQRSDQRSVRVQDPPTTPTLEPTVPQPQVTIGTIGATFFERGLVPDSTLKTSHEDNLGTIIGSAVGGVLLVTLAIVLAGVICYRRRQTFRGDYLTKNYTPPSGMQKESQVDVLQTVNLGPYPECTKQDQHPMNNLILSQHMGSMQKPNWDSMDSYKNRYQEQYERPVDYYEGNKMPTKHPHEDGYDDNEEDFVSHVDGSVISRKEWYV